MAVIIETDPEVKFTQPLDKRTNTTTHLILHHADMYGTVKKVHDVHLGIGYRGIGYNFYILRDGNIYQGRGWEYIGAHCATKDGTVDCNPYSIGICFEGRYHNIDRVLPLAQKNAGTKLIAEALTKYPTIKTICGHKDMMPKWEPTACPGQYFPLADLIRVGWSSLVPVPGVPVSGV